MSGDQSQRAELKRTMLRLLDARAVEHPAGHQGKLAARYVLHRADGEAIEIMFEKHPASPANLWLAEREGAPLLALGIDHRRSPATDLLVPGAEDGSVRYGRHSGLRPMRQLAYADLICFTVGTAGELEALLTGLAAPGRWAPHTVRPDRE